ncbi:ABC transporter permease [Rhizobium sp. Leaf384]|uniref:TRAP transporter large permease n=1 Tax=unclassified Rhizobium TaxID=2613769 RepID=UPI000713E7B0|nr:MULTISPECIES: TRAP transporter large permease subunit [unclassified Rhizobium]KQS77229.1 ABC transporter permease [Rhizobium sp. Leaf384]KQS78609.1 ABC transporter permease [Rhizobium sp. Leaf383]
MASVLLHGLDRLLGALAGFVLAIMLGVVITGIVLRYGFHTGLLGAEDLGIWLHIALISVGAPLALNGPLAMRLDVLVSRLPPLPQRAAAICADAVSVLAGLVLVSGGTAVIGMVGGTSPTLGLPEALRFALPVFGGGALLVRLFLTRIAQGDRVGAVVGPLLGVALHLFAGHAVIETSWPPSLFLALLAGLGLLVSAPLSHAFLAAAAMAVAFGSSLPEPAILSTTIAGLSKFLLLAVPFFLLTGALLTASGAADRLVRFAASLVGHRRAGLAQTVLLTSVLFSGASGSSVANAAFGAETFQPELVRHGYPPAQAGAIIAATSVLDNIIPPSIAFLLLAAATNLSIGSLLTGGFVAGGLMALCLAVAIALTAGEHGRTPRVGRRVQARAALSAIPAFGLGLIVVFGIRVGIVTTTEAAALAATYTFGLALVAQRGARDVSRVFRQAAVEASAIGLLIGTAAPFAFLLAIDDIAGVMQSLVTLLGGSALSVLLLSNLVLLALGLILDIGAAILLIGPVLLPAAVAAGIDPVHFGVILVVNLMIHGLTPPLGLLVFVVSGVTGVPALALFRAVLPYLAALLVALVVLSALALIFRP